MALLVSEFVVVLSSTLMPYALRDSAIEWVLDRYKERTPKDPTIHERFNTYRFRDYKEEVIELLARVTAVSVQTISLIAQMPNEP